MVNDSITNCVQSENVFSQQSIQNNKTLFSYPATKPCETLPLFSNSRLSLPLFSPPSESSFAQDQIFSSLVPSIKNHNKRKTKSAGPVPYTSSQYSFWKKASLNWVKSVNNDFAMSSSFSLNLLKSLWRKLINLPKPILIYLCISVIFVICSIIYHHPLLNLLNSISNWIISLGWQ